MAFPYTAPSQTDPDHFLLLKIAAALYEIQAGGGGGSGDMTKAVYDPANVAEQLVGLTAIQTLTNKTIDGLNNTLTNIPAAGNNQEVQFNNAGVLGASSLLTFNGGVLNVGGVGGVGEVDLASDGVSQPHVGMANVAGGSVNLQPGTDLASGTITVPIVTGTMVVDSATQTLSNKTLVAPALGTPVSGTLTNCTGLPAAGVVGTAAILGANTFTRLQTITQGTANEGVLASTGYSLTGANTQSLISLAGTLNTTGSPYVIYSDITNTASGANTRLIRLDVGGAHRFSVATDGEVRYSSDNHGFASYGAAEAVYRVGGTDILLVRNGGATLTLLGDHVLNFNGSGSCLMVSDATSHAIAMRSGANAQSFRVYGTFTDASNYVRASLNSTSTLVTLAAETAGTGADDVDIDIATAGTGLVNFATQSATVETVVSDATVQIKIGGTTYKVCLKT